MKERNFFRGSLLMFDHLAAFAIFAVKQCVVIPVIYYSLNNLV